VIVHVDAPALAGEGDSRRCGLNDDTPLAAATARRLACDASVIQILERDGVPLRLGRKTRSIPPALRRALASRDGGCRFPGCGSRRFVDGHRIEHWAHGGNTDLDNLVQLCGAHHRLLHEGGYSTRRLPGGDLSFRPAGRPRHPALSPPAARQRGAPRPPPAPGCLRPAVARPARPRPRRRRGAGLGRAGQREPPGV